MSVIKAVCIAAGWPYCKEHDKARRFSSDGCAHLHPLPPKHYYLCEYPNRECSCHDFGHKPPPMHATNEGER